LKRGKGKAAAPPTINAKKAQPIRTNMPRNRQKSAKERITKPEKKKATSKRRSPILDSGSQEKEGDEKNFRQKGLAKRDDQHLGPGARVVMPKPVRKKKYREKRGGERPRPKKVNP